MGCDLAWGLELQVPEPSGGLCLRTVTVALGCFLAIDRKGMAVTSALLERHRGQKRGRGSARGVGSRRTDCRVVSRVGWLKLGWFMVMSFLRVPSDS